MRRLALTILVIALPAAGCGSDDEPAAPEAPRSGPLVTYQRTGGIAGLDEELTIERDGQASLATGFDGAQTAFEVPAAELDELEAELAAADFDAIEKAPADAGCADCFVYEIAYEGETITFDDLARPPESVSAVVAHLGKIAMANQPPAEAPVEPGA